MEVAKHRVDSKPISACLHAGRGYAIKKQSTEADEASESG